MADRKRHGRDSKSGNSPWANMIRPTFSYKKRACRYCEDKEAEIDYKDTASLKKFTSDLGKIIGRKKTGLCAKHQRQVVREIKRARYMALMPYTAQVKF